MSADTRAAILAAIAGQPSISPSQLAARLGLTSAGVRYHLAQLCELGLIEAIPTATPGSTPNPRGRPARCYRIRPERAPDNLPMLCAALLDRFLAALPEDEPAAWDSLANAFGDPPPAAKSASFRLNAAVARLNQMNYQAGWEAGPQGPRLRLHNCPYAALKSIAPQHWQAEPALCRLDAALLRRLTGLPLRQTARSDFNPAAPGACVFEP